MCACASVREWTVTLHVLLILAQALLGTTDHFIYKELMKGNEDNTFLKGYLYVHVHSTHYNIEICMFTHIYILHTSIYNIHIHVHVFICVYVLVYLYVLCTYNIIHIYTCLYVTLRLLVCVFVCVLGVCVPS